MSGEAPEGASNGAEVKSDGADLMKPVEEVPRTLRSVPRPTSRKSVESAPVVVTPAADPVPAPEPAVQAEPDPPAPEKPAEFVEADTAQSSDSAPTQRQPVVAAAAVAGEPPLAEGPPEIQRFLSPPPGAPRSEMPSDSTGGRRRSRRTVKIPDDAVPPKAASLPPALATPPPAIPPSPPVPVLGARPGVPRPAPRPAPQEEAVNLGPPPPMEGEVDVAPVVQVQGASADDLPPVSSGPPPLPPPDSFEVIRPLPIIGIGTMPPPPPEQAETEAEGALSPPRPPLLASPDLAPPMVPQGSPPPVPSPLPKPPVVEEVEAVEDSEVDEAVAPPPHSDEIEALHDDDVVPDRISINDEIVVEKPPISKRPPPPPPKRPAVEGAPPSGVSPPPPAVRASELVTPPSGPPSGVAAAQSTPSPASQPAPDSGAQRAPASTPPSAATVDFGRKRPKPWWEEIFGDDLLHTMEKLDRKAIRTECDFIEDRLGLEKGAVMLDIACGSGAHAVELAGRGYSVVGFDLSLAMLARAQDEAQERGQRLNFLHGDMREIAFEEAFDGTFCWNTSFGYFDDEKNLNVLSRIHRGLRKGGMFLLDVTNRDYICPRQPSLVWFEGDGCVCMDEVFVDFFTSRLRVKRTVMFEDGRSREVDYSIRLYGLHELGRMLHDTGFKVVEVTGHPAHPGVFFGSESPRVIILAERS